MPLYLHSSDQERALAFPNGDSERTTMNTYNVEFAGDHFWIGTTVTATDEDTAIDYARDQIHQESGIQWDTLRTLPHAEADYIGVAE